MAVYVDTEVDALNIARALAEVSPERRRQALRYTSESARRQSLAVYLLLKRALSTEYGITGNPEFAFAPNGGKPILRDYPNIHFNLSHTLGVAACAVAERPVGIDVETISPFTAAVAERVLSAEELEAVRAAPEPNLAFAILWTRKEALLKRRGTGITDDTQFATLLTGLAPTAFHTTVDRARGYVLTVT